METNRPTRALLVTAALLDLVLVFVFVLLGRISHGEEVTAAGLASTWWPFLVGLVVGWLVARAWRRPAALVWTGIVVVVSTIVLGMVLRLVTGQGADPAFILVATGVVGVFLLGWRALALMVRRRAGARAS